MIIATRANTTTRAPIKVSGNNIVNIFNILSAPKVFTASGFRTRRPLYAALGVGRLLVVEEGL